MTNWYENRLPDVEFIKRRLQEIIPENVDNAGYARNITAARTVFVMLYVYAIEGESGRIRPSTVTVMSDAQAMKQSRAEREQWRSEMLGAKKPNIVDRWYSENTREPIRDDTIAVLKQIGAVEEVPGIPTTSSKPRYYLARDFVDLLNPLLIGTELEEAIGEWRANHLSKSAIILQSLKERKQNSEVIVEFGHTKHALAPGPSSILTKYAIEVFAKSFLKRPEVLLISQSKKKIDWHFGELLENLGIVIDPQKTLPDIIIAETEPKEFRIVFIEIVHTDGPISNERKKQLLEIAFESKLTEDDCAFVTVFASRSVPAYRKAQASLAWGSFVWFADEPDRIIHLVDVPKEGKYTLSDFLKKKT